MVGSGFFWGAAMFIQAAILGHLQTAADGVSDEREFLLDHYKDPNTMNSMIFLKGYQWPFDVRKVPDGSSQIDLLVHEETVGRGRRASAPRSNGWRR